MVTQAEVFGAGSCEMRHVDRTKVWLSIDRRYGFDTKVRLLTLLAISKGLTTARTAIVLAN